MAILAVAIGCGCSKRDDSSSKPLPAAPSSTTHAAPQGKPKLPDELQSKPKPPEPEPDEPLVVGPPKPPEWDGPFLVVTQSSGGVYSEPSSERKKKIGYLRNGGKIAVKSEIVSEDDCRRGWHEVVGGGFVCASVGTTDPKDRELKFVQKQPALDESLPYVYARNAKNGTPLYRSVPTPEQMYGYEPYLEAAKKWREKQAAAAAAEAKSKRDDRTETKDAESSLQPVSSSTHERVEDDPVPETSAGGKEKGKARRKRKAMAKATARAQARGEDKVEASSQSEAEAARPREDEARDEERDETNGQHEGEARDEEPEQPEEPATPWWQQDSEDANLHEVTLEDLQKEADDVLAMRMMKGFYVAIDRTFRWNDRLWYKTTKDLVAPADRFWQVAASTFHGVDLDGEKFSLPVGFVYGNTKTATTYALDSDDKLKPSGSVERMDAVNLTGKQRKIGKNNYFETSAGSWIKEYQIRVAQSVQPKEDIGPRERWIDINVSTQTLVAYVGNKPVYATMVSSGKESTIKEKDHRTPRGEWRIREKHLATTMDGDGTAAGDLPYSIEDVPFVAYFHRSYAVHAAFWHRNYGVRMSHGCVNLSPLDAKWVFFFTDPQLPAGWHGVWSTAKNPGSRVVIHE